MSNNIKLKTNSDDKFLNVDITQKFDFIEILSLKISQEDVYRKFCSDYGVVVGRVIVNNGFGVPNARVSVFIPIDDVDKNNDEIFTLYPFETITEKDINGIGYNLLPNNPKGKDECYTTIGTFPTKREIQDNVNVEHVYKKYYKFSTVTNKSGDFMLFGLPIGTHYLHVDADISDIGILKQSPFDSIAQGAKESQFESPSKYKDRDESPSPNQLKSVTPFSITVVPFWGDLDQCSIGITRADIDLKTRIIPSAIFMGSLITDSDKNSVNKNCRPRRNVGKSDEMSTGEGTIEMLRYNNDGLIERYDVSGLEAIDQNGTWAYQIPMNLDYKITSEDGRLISSNDETKGIPTRSRVRFKIKTNATGEEGRLRTRASYLVPHNPDNFNDSDFTFNKNTRDKFFTDLYWNKIYTVSNHIPRVQPNTNTGNRNFIGLKDVDEGRNNPIPFNRLDSDFDPLFFIICILVFIITQLICLINLVLIPFINLVIIILNVVLFLICEVIKAITNIICGVIDGVNDVLGYLGISLTPNGAECKRRGCIGCWNGSSCSCRNIIPVIPYITLGCPANKDNKPYAPCALNTPPPYSQTFNATTQSLLPSTTSSNSCGTYGASNANTFYHPGSSNCERDKLPFGDDAGFIQCILLALAEVLNVFRFDFYNDWINGTLYSHLFKYKYKRNGRDKFCDTYRSPNNYIVDTCTGNGISSSKTQRIREGYAIKFEDELFYPPFSRKSSYKLFATKIVSIGAVYDCDWQGIPKIHPFLTDTSYEKPPLISEYNGDNPTLIEVSGYDNSGCSGTGGVLVGGINCIGLENGSDQCNNIKRFSELGIGLDEDRTDEGGTPIDNKITNADVENPFIRGGFILANDPNMFNNNSIILTNIDINLYDYLDSKYHIFRSPSNQHITQYEHSFFFYFGLNANYTALTKMNKKYFPACVREENSDFLIIEESISPDDASPNPTGSLAISTIGGVGPYTYTWSGPTSNGITFPIINNVEDITNLISGTYNVTVIDSVGSQANGSFIVPGPPTLQCDIQPSNPTKNSEDDGSVLATILSGVGPFDLKLERLDNGNLISVEEVLNLNVISYEFTNLIAGDYIVTITDSLTPKTECVTDTILTEPAAITINKDIKHSPCFGANEGEISLLVSGGQQPYTFNWVLIEDQSIIFENASSYNGLRPGTYEITITDSANQVIIENIVINEPSEITLIKTPKNITCFNSEVDYSQNGSISFITQGGTPPYNYKLERTGILVTQGTVTSTTTTLNNLMFGEPQFSGRYELVITDSNDCSIISEFIIRRPEFKLDVVIDYDIETIIDFSNSTTLRKELDCNFTSSGGWSNTPINYSNPSGPKVGSITSIKWFIGDNGLPGGFVNGTSNINESNFTEMGTNQEVIDYNINNFLNNTTIILKVTESNGTGGTCVKYYGIEI